MTTFWIIAAVVLAATVGLLLKPMLKARDQSPRHATLLLTATGIPVLTLALYLNLGAWRAEAPQADEVHNVDNIAEQLAARLQRQGGTLEEWMMLGRSYVVTGRYVQAAAAFAQARDEAGGDNPEVLAHYAEALVLADQTRLTGEAGQMFETVLAASPQDPRGLWYGGMADFARGNYQRAVERWEGLLQQTPPENLRRVISQRIDEARRLAAAGMPMDGTTGDEPGAAAARETVAANAVTADTGSQDETAVPSSGALQVTVSAEPELVSGVNPNTPVFVLARSSEPGPPLAAKRMRVADLPFTLELSDQDAMMPGRTLSASSRVEVVARIALGGTPNAQPGDLFGSEALDMAGAPRNLDIRISRIVP